MKTGKHACMIMLGCLILTMSFGQAVEIGDLSENPVRFAILGDRTGGHVEGIYGKVVAEIEPLKPEFVMTVGDMIEGYETDTSAIIAEWREYLEIVKPLSMPIRYTPGNHDITYDVDEEPYRRFIGEPYYSFDHRGLHLVVLDNSRWDFVEDLPAEQIDWLIADLTASREALQTVVFMHKPFWYATVVLNKPDTLHELFRNFGVDAVFTGHFHEYFSGEYDGILYTSIGSSGAGSHLNDEVIGYHFGWVTVGGDGITVVPIKMGSVLPWDVITAEDSYFMSRIERQAITCIEPVPLDPDLKILSSSVMVKVVNPSESLMLTDTLRWDIPENWRVMPPTVPLSVAPGGESTLTFELMQRSELYPLPAVSARFPYKAGQAHRVSRDLHVARRAICACVDERPRIDGKVTDPCWQGGESLLLDDEGNPAKCDSTIFFFAYDDSALYLAAECYESVMDSIFDAVDEHDGAVYSEDCIGYFFQPDLERDIIYQVYLNPNGVIFDQSLAPKEDDYIIGDREWNIAPEVAVHRGANFWSVEVRIPLDQLKATVAAENEWGLNFRRKQKRLNSAYDWQSPIDYDPATYGRLYFE